MIGLWFALAVAGPPKQPPAPKPPPAPVPSTRCSHQRSELMAKIVARMVGGQGVQIILSRGSQHGVKPGDAGSLRIDGKDIVCFKITSVRQLSSTATVTIPIDLVGKVTEVRISATGDQPIDRRPPGTVG